MSVQKVCETCGSGFLVKAARADTARWCSKACQRNKVEKVCQQCGTGFTVPNRRSDEVKFCSVACKTEAGWALLKCCVCGAAVRRKKSDNSKSVRIHCSRACFHASRVGTPRSAAPKVRVRKSCETCASDFWVIASRKDKARWCSRKCQSASPEFRAECSEKQSGPKAWRWKGGAYLLKSGYFKGKTRRRGVLKTTYSHREIVLAELLKADPTHPFIEGAWLSSKIEVHHIDRNRTNNDLSNLLAVTKPAHARIHNHNEKPLPGECWPPDPSSW